MKQKIFLPLLYLLLLAGILVPTFLTHQHILTGRTILLPGESIYAMAIDNENRVWVRTWNEIVMIEDMKTASYDLNISYLYLPRDLQIIGFDEQDQVWVIASTGTKGDASGVYGFNGKDFVLQKKISYDWPTKKELPCCLSLDTESVIESQIRGYLAFLEIGDSNKYLFLKDDQGNLWAGTDSGLVHFSADFHIPAPPLTVLHIFLTSGGYWILGVIVTTLYWVRSFKNGNIDIQQLRPKKIPSIWYILGIGTLVGLFLGPQNFLFDRRAGDPLMHYFLPGQFGLTVVIIEIACAIIGAAIGQKKAKSISGKWLWLSIGAMIGTWLLLPIGSLFWIIFIGGY